MNTVIHAQPAYVQLEKSAAGSKRFYRPELDSLRFCAFLAVFMAHVMPHDEAFYLQHHILPAGVARLLCAVFVSGAFGVDVFFALSAYLITILLIREKAFRGGHIDVKKFYLRRILRIWPLYFFAIAIAIILPRWDATQKLGWPYVAGYLLLAGNWVYAWLGMPTSVALPLWSISIEEQFYLAWPIVFRKLSHQALILVAIGLLLLANLSRIWLVYVHSFGAGVEYNTLARLDPIAMGILVALILGEGGAKLSLASRWTLVAGSISLWCLISGFTRLNAPREIAPVLGTLVGRPLVALGAIGILIAVISRSSVVSIAKKGSWISYLGRISYGLYVYHMLSLWIVRHFVHRGSVVGYLSYAASGLALTILMSAVSYRWLETPFLKMKEHLSIVRSRPI